MATGDGRRHAGQADDVNFAGSARSDRALLLAAPAPGCTDPDGAGNALQAQVDANRQVPIGAAGAVPELSGARGARPVLRLRPGEHGEGARRRSWPTTAPARRGRGPARGRDHLARSGTSRSNPPRRRSTSRARSSRAAPATPARSWSPRASTRTTRRTTDARPATSRRSATAGATAPRSTRRTARGALGRISIGQLKSRFPAGHRFTGPSRRRARANDNGRPNAAPHAFTVKARRPRGPRRPR